MKYNIIPLEKSFAVNPKSIFWSTKNGNNKPANFTLSSGQLCWFDCDKCFHSFEIRLSVVNRGGWCNFCSNNKLCNNEECKICFEKSFASVEKSTYWSNKNILKPREVFKSVATKFIFNCDKCNHEFESALEKISGANRWCPYCSNKKLCGDLNCKDCFQKSSASYPQVKYWSKKNNEKPEFVYAKGDKYIWFDCDKCEHDFNAQIKNVARSNQWCPYCNSFNICLDNECKMCFEKSFASHEKSKYWHEKNEKNPREVSKGTSDKYWFNCDKCDHIFEKSLGAISGNREGWCPYCVNKKLCDEDDCVDCFKKSFASSEKVKFWSKKNEDDPRKLFRYNEQKKYWFYCDKCDLEFDTILGNVTTGNWCPFCVNQTETKFYKQMIKIYPDIKRQLKVEWCKKKTYLPFDFYLEKEKIIIEVDGPQHFLQTSNWEAPEIQRENDSYKQMLANTNKYSVIRIIQSDIFDEKYNWYEEIIFNINKIIRENNIQNIYMCKNNEYDELIKLLKAKSIRRKTENKINKYDESEILELEKELFG